MAQEFLSWVFEPGRTADELFTVKLLIEGMRGRPSWPFRDRAPSFEEQIEARNARAAKPAYQPVLPRGATNRT